MNRRVWCVVALVSSAAGAAACNDSYDDSAGSYDAATPDGGADATSPDGGASDSSSGDAGADAAPADAGDGGAATARLLLTGNAAQSTELVAFNVATKHIDGTLTYPGSIGATSTSSPDPYVLEQKHDVVGRLDRSSPWLVDSSWNVAVQDDAGDSYADPDGVVVGAGSKAYVLLYNRNDILVIDPTQTADAGAPLSKIDLSGFVQAADEDGHVEVTAGVYVEATGLLYVLLGNIDLFDVAGDGYTQLCAATTPTIIAIDTATDAPVALAGGDAHGALHLAGYNPGALAYDAESDRLIVLDYGCNTPEPDAGAGPIQKREIEALSLFTGQSTLLLDANAQGFPGGFSFIDQGRAIVQFYSPDFSTLSTYTWDPSAPTLGPAIPNAPDSWVYDGAGNLLGVTTVYEADGGSELDVVSVRIADGQVTTLGTNPFTLPGVFSSAVDIWPHP